MSEAGSDTAELIELSASTAIGRIEAGEISADEYFDAYAGAAAGDELNAYLWRAEPGSRGAGGDTLRGAPIAVKDLFCTEGIETTAGSRILEGYRPPYTATAVRRLGEAGARLLGKTNMDEFAMGSSNENSGYGPVRNPWDRDRVPGGSSGGSAAAVAGGLAPWALGTDTGGSIRQPASLCGIVGLKPTYGAISRYGMVAFASSLDQCGPLTRTVTDAALLLKLMEGRDRHDSTSTGIDGGVELPGRTDLNGLRFGVARDFSHHAEGVEPGVADVFERSLRTIESLGGTIEEIELPNAEHGISAYYVIAPAEASSNLQRYDGVRYGLREPADTLDPMYERTRAAGFGDEVKRRIMLGTYALSSGYYDAYYGRAQKVRTRIAEDFARRLRRRSTWSSRRPRRRSRSSSGRGPPTRSRCTSPITSRCRCRSPGSRRSRFPPAPQRPLAAAPSCPSACRLRRPRSPRTGSSTPLTRSNKKSTFRPSPPPRVRGRPGQVRDDRGGGT